MYDIILSRPIILRRATDTSYDHRPITLRRATDTSYDHSVVYDSMLIRCAAVLHYG